MSKPSIPDTLVISPGIYEIGVDELGNITYLSRKNPSEEKEPVLPGFFKLIVPKKTTLVYV